MSSTKLTSVCAAGVFAAIGACAANASDAANSPIAQLTALSGDVLVDQGQSIAPAKAGTELAALDRVLVLEQGKATLAFANGCRDEITGPATRLISAEGTCAQGEATSLSKVTADAASSADVRALELAATSMMDERALGLAIFGAFAAGGIIWAITDDDNNNKPPATFAAQTTPPPLSP